MGIPVKETGKCIELTGAVMTPYLRRLSAHRKNEIGVGIRKDIITSMILELCLERPVSPDQR